MSYFSPPFGAKTKSERGALTFTMVRSRVTAAKLDSTKILQEYQRTNNQKAPIPHEFTRIFHYLGHKLRSQRFANTTGSAGTRFIFKVVFAEGIVSPKAL